MGEESSRRPPKDRNQFEGPCRRKTITNGNASGLSTSAFITKAWSGADPPRQSRRPSIEHQAVAQILGELARVRDRLDAIGAASWPGGAVMLEEAVRSLTEIRAACFKALGRKP
jgi:hypothetical protein